MRSEARVLPKATPAMARRVWSRQRRPSARRVARAMQQAGYPVHFTTIARWRAQNWKVEAADHPLEIARGHIESLAPLVSGDPATNLQDLIDDPAHKRDLNELTDGELLRKAAREIAIATAVLSKAIQKRTTVALNMEEVTHALLSIAACLAALPGAFDQAISLDAADQSLGARTRP